jgi:iron complex transport system substrate-binding protein
MSDYVDRIDVALGSAAPKPTTRPKVAIIMPGEGGSAMIAGTKTFEADVFREVGGSPVGPDTDKFVPVNAETLISENPDLIVVPTTKATGAHDIQEIVSDPKFKSTNAVKNGHIQAMDEDIVLRRGTRVDHFIEGAYKAVISAAGNH